MIALLTLGFIACRSRGPLSRRPRRHRGLAGRRGHGVKLTGVFMVGAPLALLLFLRRGERRALIPASALGLQSPVASPTSCVTGLDSGNRRLPLRFTDLRARTLASRAARAMGSLGNAFSGAAGWNALAMAWSQGPTHPLWSILLPLSLGGRPSLEPGATGAIRPLGRAAARSFSCRAASVAWMIFTHLLSRAFPAPRILAPQAGILIGIAAGSAMRGPPPRGHARSPVLVCGRPPSFPCPWHPWRAVAEEQRQGETPRSSSECQGLRRAHPGGYYRRAPGAGLWTRPIEYRDDFVPLPRDCQGVTSTGSSLLRALSPCAPTVLQHALGAKSGLELARADTGFIADQHGAMGPGVLEPALGIQRTSGLSVGGARIAQSSAWRRIGDPMVSLALVQPVPPLMVHGTARSDRSGKPGDQRGLRPWGPRRQPPVRPLRSSARRTPTTPRAEPGHDIAGLERVLSSA
jgi:hypothetical protein